MKKRLTALFILILFLFTQVSSGQTDTTLIVIFHTNDMHAKIDNYAKLAYIVKEYRQTNPNVFLISAGDLFTGNPIVDQYEDKGLPMIELMNLSGYNLSCVGNHEFDYGQKQLSSLIKKSDFPYICANIHITNPDLKSIKPYTKLYTKEGISMGFLGLIQIEDNKLPASNPINLKGLSFNDPMKTVKKFASYKDSSDIFIALTHIGYDQDIILASKNKYFDLIIGGHSHTKLDKGEIFGNTV
jgi:5'-nucleotidase/UDP-sugar diphosphatase